MAFSIPVVKIVGGIIVSGLLVSTSLIIREMVRTSTKKAIDLEEVCHEEELEGEEGGKEICCLGLL
ncbi:hypothetical protein WEN_02370 [Mycoplasma wenyonii str. Massachusetts]|uniref:Uncharacterized protein n=1 Tax=Mycoplasma wenyonii (strain Massachusetts) TaxID=1197325 RepID=I6YBB5_MYCWM|nr:hypothetical protein [Mycoplasma wenyonii]AFN65261.1 hypothetical protein WEN_02370 [Mycoplasma wenyonii str. Massachusetts]